ncbi:hypothetical protein QBC38DRAFT_460163 [Podospora fimiseda]|uniref:Uncharacterized protein n=1 Tax=Podospora fimiseda TaxID=252190 RepID=A0AAN7BGR3_9PEZI|nr:hypothetical protein QBC38DRAFT_460163 [Podospora fimiseda]
MTFPPPRNPDDPGQGPLVIGFTWTFTAMAVIACSLRMLVSRKRKNGRLGVGDWLMFIAMLSEIVNQILVTISYSHGLGKHDLDLIWPNQLIQVCPQMELDSNSPRHVHLNPRPNLNNHLAPPPLRRA